MTNTDPHRQPSQDMSDAVDKAIAWDAISSKNEKIASLLARIATTGLIDAPAPPSSEVAR